MRKVGITFVGAESILSPVRSRAGDAGQSKTHLTSGRDVRFPVSARGRPRDVVIRSSDDFEHAAISLCLATGSSSRRRRVITSSGMVHLSVSSDCSILLELERLKCCRATGRPGGCWENGCTETYVQSLSSEGVQQKYRTKPSTSSAGYRSSATGNVVNT